jgi:outer membrane protein insertion porin family
MASPLSFTSLVGRKIISVGLQGHGPIDVSVLLASLASKRGGTVNPDMLREDMRKVWRVGAFQDLQLSARKARAGVHLTFAVKRRPHVGRVSVSGGVPASSPELQRLRLLGGSTYDPMRLRRSAERLKDLYLRRGYLNARLTARVGCPVDSKVDIGLAIERGPRYLVRHITFAGNRRLKDKTLRPLIATHDGSVNTQGMPFRADLFEQDRERWIGAYYDAGMIKAEIKVAQVQRVVSKTALDITVVIEEGPVFRYGKIEVACPNYAAARCQTANHLASGEVFCGSEARKLMVKLREVVGHSRTELGHSPKVIMVTPKADIDLETHTVDIRYEVGVNP